MFESASKILEHYVKIGNRQFWRFDIYSIEAQRGESPEDLYYLCEIRGGWVVVFETDYVHSLDEAAKEAADIFGSEDFRVAHWLTKRDAHGEAGTLPLEAGSDKSQHNRLVLEIEGTYLRCAVLGIETSIPHENRYSPLAYGGGE